MKILVKLDHEICLTEFKNACKESDQFQLSPVGSQFRAIFEHPPPPPIFF